MKGARRVLALAALLALMPYGIALLVFQGATLPLYLAVMKRIAPASGVLLAALAVLTSGMGLLRWHQADRAMRRGLPLPRHPAPGYLALGLIVVGVIALGLVIAKVVMG